MNPFLERHKNKIAILLPLFLLCIIILGGLYVLSLSDNKIDQEAIKRDKIAEELFNGLNVGAKAFVVYDGTNNKVIYAKNPSAQLPLASLTKVMSAMVALDLADKETLIDINSGNNFNPNDRNAIVPGRWRLSDLLRLALVSSSNSAINATSRALTTPEDFISRMNKKAQDFGLHQTYFLNESGLDINATLAGAYGSAANAAILFNNAVEKYPDIFGATRFGSIVLASTEGLQSTALNTNSTVGSINNILASKTGFTDLAQGNLVIAFEVRPGVRLVVVVLGSTQDGRFSDVEILTKTALAYYSLI